LAQQVAVSPPPMMVMPPALVRATTEDIRALLPLAICNTYKYSCLCGSLLESVQEGKEEIIYHFRQHSVCLQSLGNIVTSYYFKVY
jgi:hypothetical protein